MNLKIRQQSIAKPEEGFASHKEDALRCEEGQLAFLADGAGGMGLFAREWADFLLEKLPATPFCDFSGFKSWMEQIWEHFFNEKKQRAEALEGGLLSKFMEEGAACTLAGLWLVPGEQDTLTGCVYGDSLVFRYDTDNGLLECWPSTGLDVFCHPPFLLNCIEEPEAEGFQRFQTTAQNCLLLIASDALAQYLLLSWTVCRTADHAQKLAEIRRRPDRLAVRLERIEAQNYAGMDFSSTVLKPLLDSLESEPAFAAYTRELLEKGLLGMDDYTLICLQAD